MAGSRVLLERQGELGELASLASRAAGGEGKLVVIAGPPGVGRTELLRAARREAEAQGLTVLSARAGVLEREHAFGVARQLVDPAPGAAAAEAEGGGGAFSQLESLYRSLTERVSRGALLVAVDRLPKREKQRSPLSFGGGSASARRRYVAAPWGDPFASAWLAACRS